MAIALSLAIVACRDRPDDGTAPQAASEALPALDLRDDTQNLLLTWIDDKGDAHVELRTSDVPAEGRGMVRVVVSNREEGTRDRFYVADLNQKQPDGGYAVRTMRRKEWEAEIAKRREAYIARTAPPPLPGPSPSPGAPQAPAPGPSATGVTAIIYGASWCKPCHQAADYLRSKGVTVIMKDIEESQAAALEMRDKLEKAHQRGGSIPIIDLRGQILVGFSRAALDRALARAARGTTL